MKIGEVGGGVRIIGGLIYVGMVGIFGMDLEKLNFIGEVGEAMNLESQVVSLELSKRLKELGVKQESLWWWHLHHHTKEWYITEKETRVPWTSYDGERYSAFTVAELGEMLPLSHNVGKTGTKKWLGYLVPDPHVWGDDYQETLSDTEANARAKMLIHLIEKGIVKP